MPPTLDLQDRRALAPGAAPVPALRILRPDEPKPLPVGLAGILSEIRQAGGPTVVVVMMPHAGAATPEPDEQVNSAAGRSPAAVATGLKLTRTMSEIKAACSRTAGLQAKEIARKVRRPCNAYFRRLLSTLYRAGVLNRNHDGYILA